MYKCILAPENLDNADKLTKALELAGKTAKQNDAEVVYVDVVDAVPTMSSRTEGKRLSDCLRNFAQ